jgi:phosphatidylinositol alpha-mannosyltransferase
MKSYIKKRSNSMAAKPPLKIGFVLDDSLDKPDGVQQYVTVLGEWLRAQGHDVHYLVGETARQDLANIHSLSRNMQVRFNGNRMSMPLPGSQKKIKNLLASENFDILHVQLPHSPWLAHRIIRAAGAETAVVGTFHIVAYSPLVTLATRLLGIWLAGSMRRFDAIFSVSEAAADYAHKTFGITSAVLPNVIDYSRFADAKPFAKYRDGRLTIVFLGRLVARKGCLQLLKAIVRLRQTHSDIPDFRVVVCGRGPLEKKLRKFVSANAIEDCVGFVGFVEESVKPRFYASADLAVFPSRGGESFGIVLIEAMASRNAAVLAGDNSGYRSVLSPRPDLLFNPHDDMALVDVLWRYMSHTELRTTAAKWGHAYARQYDVTRVGARLLNEYNQALRKRRQQ